MITSEQVLTHYDPNKENGHPSCFWEGDWTRLDLFKQDLSIQANNRQIDQFVANGGSGTHHFSIGQRVI